MGNSTKIIIVVVAIIAIAIFSFIGNKIVKKKKRNKLHNEYTDEMNAIEETYNNLVSELERTKKISKNEESINLYNTWLEEFDIINEKKEDIDATFNEFNDQYDKEDHNNFMICYDELEGKLFKFNEDLNILFKKVKQYTNYELENTRISLTLKTRLKSISSDFEQKLEYLEIYSKSFFEEITSAQGLITEFENLQRSGEYPEGRNILKNCNRKIDKIDFILKIILNFHEYLSQLDTDIQMMSKIGTEITKIGFSLNISDFGLKIGAFENERESILEKVARIDFENDLVKEDLKLLEDNINSLDGNISEFKDMVEEKFNFIKEIIAVLSKNEKLIETANDLIFGAITEKNKIITLYELPDIRQVKKLDSEIEIYDIFKKDYTKLIEIIHNAKEDFVTLKLRIEQSNQYLIRLLKNVESAVNELRSIRNDEIHARESLAYYYRSSVEINLYMRRYGHLDSMSNDLKSLTLDLDIKLRNLVAILEKEPLNISEVRKLDSSVDKIINTLKNQYLLTDVKQRIGCELLINYMARFNTTDELNLTIKRLHNLYKNCEYKKILIEVLELLTSLTDDGPTRYKNIVSKVKISGVDDLFLA